MSATEKILALMKEKNVSSAELCRACGLNHSAINNWSSGKAKPSTDALAKIADHFGVSVDYLLGRADPSRQPQDLDEDEIRFALYEGEKKLLTESDEEEIKNFVRFVIDKRKKEQGNK